LLPLDRDSTLTFLKLQGNSLEETSMDQSPIAISTLTSIGSTLFDLYKKSYMAMAEAILLS